MQKSFLCSVLVCAVVGLTSAPAQAGWTWNGGCPYYDGVSYGLVAPPPGVVGGNIRVKQNYRFFLLGSFCPV